MPHTHTSPSSDTYPASLLTTHSRGVGIPQTGLSPTTPVLTPTGWHCAGSLLPGDDIVGPGGITTPVIDVSHRALNMACSDGANESAPVYIPRMVLGNLTAFAVLGDQLLHLPQGTASGQPTSASQLVGAYGVRRLDLDEMPVAILLTFDVETVVNCAHGGKVVCAGQKDYQFPGWAPQLAA